MAKQLVALRKTPRFTALPGATDPVANNKALLDHFLPPKDPQPNMGYLSRDPSSVPLSKDEIRLALFKSSPSLATGPDGFPTL